MVECRLKIVTKPGASSRSDAFYVPSASLDALMTALSSVSECIDSISILPLSPGGGRSGICGYLVECPNPSVPTPPLCQSYRLHLGRIYIPSDSELRPPITKSELSRLLPLERYVFHPSIGLAGFDDADRLRPESLIKLPHCNSIETWFAPSPDRRIASSIAKLLSPPTIEFETLFDTEQRSIGNLDTGDVPPSPGERKIGMPGSLSGIGRFIGAVFFAGIGKFTKLAPKSSGNSPTWVNKVENWATRKFEDLTGARKKEIERLLNLLKSNPDLGLQYALPLNQNNAHRGVSPPGSRLDRRATDFSLRKALGGGGPSDQWDLSYNDQLDLRRSYLEAANREIALKRYSRAAYIYAQLLNDFRSAANALKQGRLYREAATLYSEKLSNPRMAAECLVDGGFLHEAIALYEPLNEFEIVGDLYAKLDDDMAAAESFERAIENANTPIDKARIARDKLRDSDRAISLLDGAWPNGTFASKAQAEQLRILCAEERFAALKALLLDISNSKRHLVSVSSQVQNLHSLLSRNLPPATRQEVRRCALTFFGDMQSKGLVSRSESDASLRALAAFDSRDLLWAQDVERFRNVTASSFKPAPPALPIAKTLQRLQVTETIKLSKEVEWQALSLIGKHEGYVALGIDGARRRLVATLGTWTSPVQHTFTWSINAAQDPASIVVSEKLCANMVSVIMPGTPLAPQSFQGPAQTRPIASIGTPTWISTDTFLVADTDSESRRFIFENNDGAVNVSQYSNNGVLLASISAIAQPLASVSIRSAFARRETLYFSAGSSLNWIDASSRYQSVELASPFTIGACSKPLRKTRLALIFENEITVVWPEQNMRSESIVSIEPGQTPAVEITHSGLLVIATEVEGLAFNTDESPRLVARFATRRFETRPVGVVESTSANCFAILYANGALDRYEMPLGGNP